MDGISTNEGADIFASAWMAANEMQDAERHIKNKNRDMAVQSVALAQSLLGWVYTYTSIHKADGGCETLEEACVKLRRLRGELLKI